MMLRELGIPSRLVNGFRTGEYNRLGDDWTVRQCDAHSWVEAYFAPYGWVEFDPTPPDPRHRRFAFVAMLANFADAIDLWWWEDVVNYDLWRQYRLVAAVSAAARSWQSSAAALFGSIRALRRGAAETLSSLVNWRWLALAVAALGGASVFILKTGIWKHLRRAARLHIYRNDRTAAARELYSEALDLLAKCGHRRGRNQTPLEFAAMLGPHPAGAPFSALTQLYNRTRFSRSADSDFLLKAGPLLKSLRSVLK
jgi:hypothetical protein